MLIRLRDGRCRRCERVLPFDALECHHLIKRDKSRQTRYHFSNGIALCHLCHRHLEDHPLENTDFAISIMGEEMWEELHELVRDTKTRVDLDDVLADLRARAA